jgi:hypothetical protein
LLLELQSKPSRKAELSLPMSGDAPVALIEMNFFFPLFSALLYLADLPFSFVYFSQRRRESAKKEEEEEEEENISLTFAG